MTVAAAALTDWMLSLALSNLPLGKWEPEYTVLFMPAGAGVVHCDRAGQRGGKCGKAGRAGARLLLRYMKRAQEKIDTSETGAAK